MKRKALVALLGLSLVVAAGLVFQGDISASSFAGSVKVTIGGTYSNAVDLVTSEAKLSTSPWGTDFTNGTGANQANVIFTDTRSTAAAEDLDIRGTALQDPFGANVACVKLKALLVRASSANTGNVILGGDAASVPFLSTAATTVTLKPGAIFVFTDPSAAGVAVTDTTGDIIQVAPSAGTVSYDIVVLCTAS